MRVRLGRWVLYQVKMPPATKPETPPTPPASPDPFVSKPAKEKSRKTESSQPSFSKPEPSKPSTVEPVIPPPLSTSASEPKGAKPAAPEPSENRERAILQVLLTPRQERAFWRYTLKSGKLFFRIFHVRISHLEGRGSFEDPYWNGVFMGLSRGCFVPDWQNQEQWTVQGDWVVSLNGWRVSWFFILFLVHALCLAWILWRAYRRALTNPLAEDLGTARRWILDHLSPLESKEN